MPHLNLKISLNYFVRTKDNRHAIDEKKDIKETFISDLLAVQTLEPV